MKVISTRFLDELCANAWSSPRIRQHSNLHVTFSEPCQRFLNAIVCGTYIRPHRHVDEKVETLFVVRGRVGVITFDENGDVAYTVVLGNEGRDGSDADAVGCEIPPAVWHTVVTLASESVLLEIKAGPFDAHRAKEFAPWSPEEGVPSAGDYLAGLVLVAAGVRGV